MTLMQPALYSSGIITPASVIHHPPPPQSYINPIHTQNADAGPSNLLTSVPLKKKSSFNGKRKRTNTPDSGDSTTQKPKNTDAPKKKKANRACFHCQKAHLTCDDSRPCKRCVKRGIADSCTEGHRKKAKYLLDDEELEQLNRSKAAPEPPQEPPQPPPPLQTTTDPFPIPINDDPLFGAPFDAGFSFGSEAANMEYSILSAILGKPSPPESGTPPPSQSQYSQQNLASTAWPSEYGSSQFEATVYSEQTMAIQTSDAALSPNFMAGYSPPQFQPSRDPLQYTSQYQPSQQQQRPLQTNMQPLQSRFTGQSLNDVLIANPGPHVGKDSVISATLATPPASDASPSSSSSVPLAAVADSMTTVVSRASSQLQTINDRVTSPYDYTEGYHFLMKHLPTRFEKNDILRIVRALAIFRPSLIALQMPLSIEDEIFVERCFQRTLIELDKLISFSGTPTVVWRRTGEICLVAPEFCLLTGWSMEDLVERRKYIYELFENQSAVEYWESFASHAFENTTQSVYSHCVLLKPTGAPIPATFCFSIRRDIFDLPSVVIGQWLPLL